MHNERRAAVASVLTDFTVIAASFLSRKGCRAGTKGLGVAVFIAGMLLFLGSLWGIVATFLLFVPAAAYRAHLEERALASRLGEEWREYGKKMFFLVPFLV